MSKPRDQPKRLLLLTGEGKGKSSSAFGMVMRAAGWGMRVAVIQFIKGKWPTGEEKAAKLLPGIDWFAMGDGFTWDTENPEQDRATSRRIWDFCRERIRGRRDDLVVLDEILYAMAYGWLSGAEVAAFLAEQRPWHGHLVLTGRSAPEELVALADTVTEMKLLKHGFSAGLTATRGVEF
ncbi:MAG: cob(I)yrinic acid a,c-diamide adenosyltransferase [Magnetococcales bacterium]|nr:cob(I)yrinic acid a,c-diamide adenosyltransferase [Magnetococcales bacterium]